MTKMTATERAEQMMLAGNLEHTVRSLRHAMMAYRIEGISHRLIFVVTEAEWDALVAITETIQFPSFTMPESIKTMTLLGVTIMKMPAPNG